MANATTLVLIPRVPRVHLELTAQTVVQEKRLTWEVSFAATNATPVMTTNAMMVALVPNSRLAILARIVLTVATVQQGHIVVQTTKSPSVPAAACSRATVIATMVVQVVCQCLDEACYGSWVRYMTSTFPLL